VISYFPPIGDRYHLKEGIEAKAKPDCKEELFNLRHAQLRNEIERIFGVTKGRFPILERAYEILDMDVQVKIVYALTGLHNFIRQNATCYDIWDTEGIEKGEVDARKNARLSNRDTFSSTAQRTKMDDFRDTMAATMWENYCEHICRIPYIGCHVICPFVYSPPGLSGPGPDHPHHHL